ncbi:Lipase member M [Apodemus speciosus]|uniref:Lipase member M n=1 Tax=Apodemus speciosus TaxID=105296 RepID=A0ABQ0FSW8_APOSI
MSDKQEADVAVTSLAAKQMPMLDHVRNLVKSMDCFTQSGDMASDSGSVFTPKKCELGTHANESRGS